MFDYVPLNDAEIESLRDAFQRADVDEDGVLSRSEAIAMLGNSPFFRQNAKFESEEEREKKTAKFLEQLDLLDKVRTTQCALASHAT